MLPVYGCVKPNRHSDPPHSDTDPQRVVSCRGSRSPCDSISRTCRAAYPACAKPVSALIIAPEVAFLCALYAAQCGKTVRGLLTHSDDDPVHLSRSHAMVVAQGRASLRTMSSRM